VTLTDLAPSTTYSYQAGPLSGSLTTAAAPASARFGTDGARITENGSLFFPVLSYEQCAATIARALAVGINMFVQVPYTGCTQPAGVTPPYVLGDAYDTRQGAGWYLPDEPDGWGITPDQMPKQRRTRVFCAFSTSHSTSTAASRRSTRNSTGARTSNSRRSPTSSASTSIRS
jgi:hypothetical protein